VAVTDHLAAHLGVLIFIRRPQIPVADFVEKEQRSHAKEQNENGKPGFSMMCCCHDD
jgi:hypothetical protein